MAPAVGDTVDVVIIIIYVFSGLLRLIHSYSIILAMTATTLKSDENQGSHHTSHFSNI